MDDIEFRKKVRLIGRLGAAFHKYGTNAQRLEESLTHLTHALGLNGHFFSTPTYLTISLDSGEDQITRHIRSFPSDVNLEKLQDLDILAGKVIHNQIDYEDALVQIRELDKRADPYPLYLSAIAFSLTSMSLSIIIGGGIKEGALSLLLGGIVGLLVVLKAKFQAIGEVFEFLASFLVTFSACLIYHFVFPYNFQNVLIASLIVIIPGLSVTIAMNELASHNLVSGTARLMGALIGLFKISFGIFFAVQANLLLFDKIALYESASLPTWSIIPAILIAASTFAVIFNAKKSDYFWVLLSCLLTVASLKLAALAFNDVISLFIASFIIGVFSNVIAKFRDRPSLVTLLPGIIFLVPGSVGIQGLNLLFESNLIAGIDTSIKMFILSITIVAGLLFANICASPRKGL